MDRIEEYLVFDYLYDRAHIGYAVIPEVLVKTMERILSLSVELYLKIAGALLHASTLLSILSKV